MNDATPAYGLWSLVIINSLVFIIFAFSFTKPKTLRDWRSFGAFSAFLIALFTEMYGFPLTIYLLFPWLSKQFPDINFLSHDAGHLLEVIFGWRSNPHFGPFHILSSILIFGGFIMLSSA
jgi:methanethiol S-methyltransferase